MLLANVSASFKLQTRGSVRLSGCLPDVSRCLCYALPRGMFGLHGCSTRRPILRGSASAPRLRLQTLKTDQNLRRVTRLIYPGSAGIVDDGVPEPPGEHFSARAGNLVAQYTPEDSIRDRLPQRITPSYSPSGIARWIPYDLKNTSICIYLHLQIFFTVVILQCSSICVNSFLFVFANILYILFCRY